MVHIEAKSKDLEALFNRIHDRGLRQRVIANVLNQIRTIVQRRAMEKAPARTGNLRRSITSTLDTQALIARVGVNARYAYYVERGTGIYGPLGKRIISKNGKTMRFHGYNNPWPGPMGKVRLTGAPRAGQSADFVFARSTTGMRPKPFLLPAWHASQDEIQQVLSIAGGQVARSMAGPQSNNFGDD